MSEGDYKKVSLDVQKEQINRILDLEPNVQLQNLAQTSVLVLNSNSLDFPKGMTKEQFFELNSFECRKRKLSNSSCDSAETNKALYGLNKDIIYYDLKDEDTLQKLALEFSCKVSEIKQANKIYNDKELHARRTIKIPVIKDGSIWDKYMNPDQNSKQLLIDIDNEEISEINDDRKNIFKVHVNHKIIPDLDFVSSEDDEDYDIFNRTNVENEQLLPPSPRKVRLGQPIDSSEPTLEDFITRVDKILLEEIKNVQSTKNGLEDVVGSMTTPVIFPGSSKQKPEKFGSVCNFSWKFYLLVLCFVAVLVPVLYFIHFYYK